jgi:hypothetical protein
MSGLKGIRSAVGPQSGGGVFRIELKKLPRYPPPGNDREEVDVPEDSPSDQALHDA